MALSADILGQPAPFRAGSAGAASLAISARRVTCRQATHPTTASILHLPQVAGGALPATPIPGRSENCRLPHSKLIVISLKQLESVAQIEAGASHFCKPISCSPGILPVARAIFQAETPVLQKMNRLTKSGGFQLRQQFQPCRWIRGNREHF